MITITDSAVLAIKRLQGEYQKPNLALRLGVMGGGCSGLTYKIDMTEEPQGNDKVFEKEGVRVFVDSKSYPYLDGLELDYFDELTKKGFQFRNPNAKATCGCGTSFDV